MGARVRLEGARREDLARIEEPPLYSLGTLLEEDIESAHRPERSTTLEQVVSPFATFFFIYDWFFIANARQQAQSYF